MMQCVKEPALLLQLRMSSGRQSVQPLAWATIPISLSALRGSGALSILDQVHFVDAGLAIPGVFPLQGEAGACCRSRVCKAKDVQCSATLFFVQVLKCLCSPP